jgi:hypothetical protein
MSSGYSQKPLEIIEVLGFARAATGFSRQFHSKLLNIATVWEINRKILFKLLAVQQLGIVVLSIRYYFAYSYVIPLALIV